MNNTTIFGKWPIKRIILISILFIGLIYFIYLPVSYDFDGTVFGSYLRYSLLKDDPSAAVQPHHPLYFPVNYGIYKLLGLTVGYRVLEYFHLQLFSLLFGLLTLWVCFRLLESRWTELPGGLLLITSGLWLTAFSYGIWYYSVEAEVHMAGLFFIVLGIYLLFFRSGTTDNQYSLPRLAYSSACFATAAGFHLTNGLIAFSILLIFLVERRPFKIMLRFFAFYGGFLLSGFLLLSVFSKVNLFQHFKNQLMGDDPMAGYVIDYWSGSADPVSFWESLKSVAHGLIVPGSPALSTLAVILFLLLAVFVIRTAYKSADRRVFYRLGAWMLPYFIFFSFWDHRNTEFKLNVFLPFILLVIISIGQLYKSSDRKKRIFLGVLFPVFVFVVAAVNHSYYITPANDLSTNRNWQVASAMGSATPSNSFILIGGCGSDLSIHNKIYISYFAYRKTFILDWMLGKGMTLADIRSRISQETIRGNPVYIFSEILRDSPTVRQLLENHNLKPGEYFEFVKNLTGGNEPVGTKKNISLPYGYYIFPVP